MNIAITIRNAETPTLESPERMFLRQIPRNRASEIRPNPQEPKSTERRPPPRGRLASRRKVRRASAADLSAEERRMGGGRAALSAFLLTRPLLIPALSSAYSSPVLSRPLLASRGGGGCDGGGQGRGGEGGDVGSGEEEFRRWGKGKLGNWRTCKDRREGEWRIKRGRDRRRSGRKGMRKGT